MKAKVLLVTTCRWFAAARLAMALRNSGFEVEVVCPADHPFAKVHSIRRIHAYRALFPTASIRRAVEASDPALLIPCDDLAVAHLHALYRGEQASNGSRSSIAALLERSLGDPANFSIMSARTELLMLAQEEGVRVPASAGISGLEEMHAWLNDHGFPAVLKADGSSGGVGVIPVETPEEAERAFAVLHSPPILARTVKRALFDGDLNLVPPFLLRRRPKMNIQQFISGHDATLAVACWKGKVLASIGFDVLHTWKPKGPASVVRWNDNREMVSATEKIVRRLNLSGLYGFDFMVEKETGKPYLIEMNPRATQTCHLALGTGHNLPAALWQAVTGSPAVETESVTAKKVIALFPQEWQRNPESAFLSTAYHDIPWDEPELVRQCIGDSLGIGQWSFGSFSKVSSLPRKS